MTARFGEFERRPRAFGCGDGVCVLENEPARSNDRAGQCLRQIAQATLPFNLIKRCEKNMENGQPVEVSVQEAGQRFEALRKASVELVAVVERKKSGKPTNHRETEYSALVKQLGRTLAACANAEPALAGALAAAPFLIERIRQSIAEESALRGAEEKALPDESGPRRRRVGTARPSTTSESSPAKQLEHAAKQLPDFREAKLAPGEPTTSSAQSVTTAAQIRTSQNLSRLEAFLITDWPKLIQSAAAEARVSASALEERISSLRDENGDIEQRRRALVELCVGQAWSSEHRDRRDFIGPLTLEHTSSTTKILIGREKIAELDFPSSHEVFGALCAERAALEATAVTLWPHLFGFVAAEQAKAGTASWPAIVHWASVRKPPAAKSAILFCLGMLNAQLLSAEHRLFFDPPTLSQQPQSVVLPRFDKPGYPDKVFAIYVDGPEVPANIREYPTNADHA